MATNKTIDIDDSAPTEAEQERNRSLTWLRVKEQGFYIALVVPAVFIIVLFLFVPLFRMFQLSFGDDTFIGDEKDIAVDYKFNTIAQYDRAVTGIFHEIIDEIPDGTVDGTNTAFELNRRPIGDTNEDGVIDTRDVDFSINGQPIPVESVRLVQEERPKGSVNGVNSIFEIALGPISDFNGDEMVDGRDVVARVGDMQKDVSAIGEVEDETPQGSLNGKNTKFIISNSPILDVNGDTKVDGADVVVKINGVTLPPATIKSIDAADGVIKLEMPPTPSSSVTGEFPEGTLDGTNKNFKVSRRPVVNHEGGIASPEDVMFRVNGVRVPIESLAFRTGVITLQDAPPAGSQLSVDYLAETTVRVDYLGGDLQTFTLLTPPPSGSQVSVDYIGGNSTSVVVATAPQPSMFRNEIPKKEPDGRAKKFAVSRPPIGDMDGSGAVNVDDVVVEIDGIPVEVFSVNARAGEFNLSEAPSRGSEIRVDYLGNPVTADYLWGTKFGPDIYRNLFRTTFVIALLTTVIALAIGYPIAYLLANVADKTRVFLLPLVIVPFWTSILVRTFAWRVVLGQEGFVNETLIWLNIIGDPLTLVGNRMGTLVGMVHILLPFMIFPLFAVMRGIPNELMRAAENLGAGPFMAFWRVYFPLTLPGLGAGALLTFILSLGFFITPALLGGPGDQMISNVIEQQIRQAFNWEFAAALAFLLLIATVFLYMIYARFMSFDRLYGEQT